MTMTQMDGSEKRTYYPPALTVFSIEDLWRELGPAQAITPGNRRRTPKPKRRTPSNPLRIPPKSGQ